MYNSLSKVARLVSFCTNMNFYLSFIRLLAVFGLMPFYDSKQQTVVRRRICQIYCMLFGAVMVFIQFYLFYMRFSTSYIYMIAPQIIMIIQAEFLSKLSYIYTIYGTGLWNLKYWEKYIKIYEYPRIYSTWYMRKVFWVFLSFVTAHTVICSYNFYEWRKSNKYIPVFVLICSMFEYFTHVLISYNLFFGIKTIQREFKILSGRFDIFLTKRNNEKFVKEIRCNGNKFREIIDIVRNYNEIFGWPLMTSTIFPTILILTGLNSVTIYLYGIRFQVFQSVGIIVSYILTTFLYFVKI